MVQAKLTQLTSPHWLKKKSSTSLAFLKETYLPPLASGEAGQAGQGLQPAGREQGHLSHLFPHKGASPGSRR